MLRTRQAAQQQEGLAPEKLTLDQSPTVEVDAARESSTLEGFETTSHEGLLDIPSGGMLGLEPTSVASETSKPVAPAPAAEGLDTLILDDFSLPAGGATSVPAAVPATPKTADSQPASGLLDFDSFALGGETPTPEAAAPSLVVPAMEFAMPAVGGAPATGLDGGHEPVGDFDFDIPLPSSGTPPASPPQESIPTMVMDVIEDAIPAVMDIVEEAVPVIVDAVTSAPTMIMDAMRIDRPNAEQPPQAAKEQSRVEAEPETLAPTQQTDVASVMEQIAAARKAKAEPSAPAERQAKSFVTETMAQLYLEQGHRAQAIEIYKQLVAARPADAELRGRLEAIELGSGSRAPHTVEVPAASTPYARLSEPIPAPTPAGRFAASGPTIRAVLRELFGIDGQSTNGSGAGNGAGDREVGSIDVLFAAESASDGLGALASAFDGGYVAPSGSIDAVFVTGSR